MLAQCGEQTRNVLMPQLEQAIVEHLGRRCAGASWLRYEDDAVARSPVVHFEYPTSSEAGFEYLRREVKLELGSLTDQRPTEQHAVRPWVVDDFPAAFPDWQCQVTSLELARTFWKKVTILHAEHHRPADQATPDRYARHYADMERLLRHPDATAMLSDHALCARVVERKSQVFARQWARYDLAVPGMLRLLPAEARLGSDARPVHRVAARLRYVAVGERDAGRFRSRGWRRLATKFGLVCRMCHDIGDELLNRRYEGLIGALQDDGAHEVAVEVSNRLDRNG
jgi:hypothetical protein